MSFIEPLANCALMLPYAIAGAFRDGTTAYEIHRTQADATATARPTRALIVASDRHQRIRRTRQFLDPADRVNKTLLERLGPERVTYIQGDSQARERFVPELRKISEYDAESKIVIYIGHGFRRHPWISSRAENTYLNSDQFRELACDDGSPLIAFFDNCYSGQFARNAHTRKNTIAVSTNTERTIKPCPKYLPLLIDAWAEGKTLEQAFVDSSEHYHARSFDYSIGERLPTWLRRVGKGIDDVLRLSKSTKQLYANGLNPSLMHL